MLLAQGEGIGSYARKVQEAGLGPLPDPKLVVRDHPKVPAPCSMSLAL